MRRQAPTPSRRPERRTFWTAAAASLVVHALAFALLLWLPRPAPPTPKPPPPMAVSIVELPPLPKPQAKQPAASAETPQPSQPQPPSHRKRASKPSSKEIARAEKPGPPAPPGSPTNDIPRATAPVAPSGSGESDTPSSTGPRLKTLVPDGTALLGRLDPPAPGVGSESQSGQTIRNTGDPDGSGRRAKAEADAAEAGALVETWSRDMIAEVRVRDGAIDDYFRQLGKELERRAQIQKPLEVKVQEGLQSFVNGYLGELSTYGASGAPTRPSGLGDQENHTGIPDPKGTHEMAARTADQNARIQEHLKRFAGGELVMIVELSQDALGRIVAVRVLKPSGDRMFDQHIIEIANQGEFPGVPDHVAARSTSGVRTTWEFRGRYNFKKKLRDMNVRNPADAAYLAAMGLGSILTGGSFDEATGNVYVIDIRDPKFEVKSKLLRLY